MQPPWTEARVRDLLLQLRNLQNTAVPLLGAKAGGLLRRLSPEFRPDILGDQRLVELLQRFPDLLAVHKNPSGGDFQIHFHTDGLFQHSSTIEPSARSESTTTSTNNLLQRGHPTIEPAMWQALVAPRHRFRWYLDLGTGQIVSVELDETGAPSPDTSPVREAHRYLEIPRVDQEVLRAKLREWAQRSVADEDARGRVLTLLEAENWFPQFREACETLEQHDWRSIHRAVVIEHLEAWAHAHGIKPSKYLRFSTASKPPAARDTPAHPRPRRSHVRAIVEDAIARMSDEELLDLRIPIRYILE